MIQSWSNIEFYDLTRETEKLRGELSSVKELYLNVCREKDSIEDLLLNITAGMTYETSP